MTCAGSRLRGARRSWKGLFARAGRKVQLDEHLEAEGPLVFDHACQLGLEGIVSKRKGSRYQSGCSRDWVKAAKQLTTAEEGEAYARKLWEAGVRVTCTRYIGTIHDFVILNAIADRPAARGAIAQATAALRSALD
jgi:alpha/beta hydrolase fold